MDQRTFLFSHILLHFCDPTSILHWWHVYVLQGQLALQHNFLSDPFRSRKIKLPPYSARTQRWRWDPWLGRFNWWAPKLGIFGDVSPCFTMFHHVSPCFTMFHHVSPCFTMFHHVSPCFTMFHHVSPCFTMFHHVSPCFTWKTKGFVCFVPRSSSWIAHNIGAKHCRWSW